ncbi:hypothetical protein N2488_06730 [SAR92 clade bacterium H231]|nr:hypothetical protein [SAR92 clade bacterium H231]
MDNRNIDGEIELLASLMAHGGDDVVIPYIQVAKIFPSNIPHPHTFDYKLIDDSSLLMWGAKNGWSITMSTEPSSSPIDKSPDIRFRRLAAG